MVILCKTVDELKKTLEKLENNGYKWNSGNPCVEWGMEHINSLPAVICFDEHIEWDDDFENYDNAISAAKFLNADADLNTEKIGGPRCERLICKTEFNEAIMKVIGEMANDPQISGISKFIIPMTGSIFAEKMSDILFKEVD